jgi:hypothetical protein
LGWGELSSEWESEYTLALSLWDGRTKGVVDLELLYLVDKLQLATGKLPVRLRGRTRLAWLGIGYQTFTITLMHLFSSKPTSSSSYESIQFCQITLALPNDDE